MENIVAWVQGHWMQITVIYLAVHKLLVSVRDALDKTPATDDNWFEKLVTAMGKLGNYLTTGKRPGA